MGEVPEGLASAGTRPLHLVIPAYDPGAALQRFLPELLQALHATGLPHRVQLIDDGSAPAEHAALVTLQRDCTARFAALASLEALPGNHGKGAAILRGWDLSRPGEVLAFVDADGSIPPEEVVHLWATWRAKQGEIAVIASRKRHPGHQVLQPLHRRVMGRVFAFWVQTWLRLDVHDSQCGCKFLSREAYLLFRAFLQERRFSFDVELLALLRRAGIPIWEEPIHWTASPFSSVRILRDVPAMLGSVLSIRRRSKSWPEFGQHR